MGRLRWLAPRLALAVGSVVVFFGGAELAVRGWDFLAYGTPKTDGQPAGLYASAPWEAPRLQPGAHLKGLRYEVSVNSLGFRGAELSAVPGDQALRIWCVGGSTTFDIYAPTDAEAWPAVAEAALRARFPERSIDLINAGVPGEMLQGSTAALRGKGRALGVDYVVVHHGPNDIRREFSTPMIDGRPPMIWERTALANALIHWFQGQGLMASGLQQRGFEGVGARNVRRSLEALLQVVHEIGAKPIFATHAARISADSSGAQLRREVGEVALQWTMSPESVREVLAGYNQLIVELARRRGAPVADFRGVVPADRSHWGDATHFTASGSALAGAELARVMEAELAGR